jgi:hypothetical protein
MLLGSVRFGYVRARPDIFTIVCKLDLNGRPACCFSETATTMAGKRGAEVPSQNPPLCRVKRPQEPSLLSLSRG